jgi:Siphovirus Gp157
MEDVPPEQLQDTLDMLKGDIQEKATNIGFVVRNLEETAEAIKRAATQATGRANAILNRADSLKSYALAQLKAAGISKVEHPMLVMSIRKNPVKVVTDFEDSIPAEFMRQPPTPPPVPDKAAIKEAIQAGREVPGAHLEQTERLEVRS